MTVTRKQPLVFEEFKAIYSKVPRLCVDLIIKTDGGILLTLRQKNGYEGQWHLPGGTVHYREAVEDSVSRIAKEELGVEVSVERLVGYIECFSEEQERGFGYAISLVFLCKLKTHTFKLDDQVEKMGFFKYPPDNTIQEQKRFLMVNTIS